jgi:hypothetical protein
MRALVMAIAHAATVRAPEYSIAETNSGISIANNNPNVTSLGMSRAETFMGPQQPKPIATQDKRPKNMNPLPATPNITGVSP